jgi:hypothetical protein
MKIGDFFDFGRYMAFGGIWQHGKYSTGCGSDLPTILRILKNDRRSRSVNNSLQPLDLDPNRIKDFAYQPKLRLYSWLSNAVVCNYSGNTSLSEVG